MSKVFGEGCAKCALDAVVDRVGQGRERESSQRTAVMWPSLGADEFFIPSSRVGSLQLFLLFLFPMTSISPILASICCVDYFYHSEYFTYIGKNYTGELNS